MNKMFCIQNDFLKHFPIKPLYLSGPILNILGTNMFFFSFYHVPQYAYDWKGFKIKYLK